MSRPENKVNTQEINKKKTIEVTRGTQKFPCTIKQIDDVYKCSTCLYYGHREVNCPSRHVHDFIDDD